MHAITKRIIEFNASRLPDIIPFKYEAMNKNKFGFYRGACHIFFEDLSKDKNFPVSPVSWISGDLHLENFGSFKSNNRLVYFDLNDFDEALMAPVAYDVFRMITSIVIAFNEMKIEKKKAMNMVKLFLKTYSTTLANGKPYYIEPQIAKGIVCTFLQNASKKKRKHILKKKTIEKKSRLSIYMDNPKHIELDKNLKRELCHFMTEWIIYNSDGPYNYEVIDAAFRLAGTGSVGLKRYVFLLKNINTPGKHLLVEMKQAVESSVLKYIHFQQPVWQS